VGDALLDYYVKAKARYPMVFVLPAVADPDDPNLPYHTISRVENGVVHLAVRPGYLVEDRTGFHEMGHVFDFIVSGRDPTFRERYWSWRFRDWPSAPSSWMVAQHEYDTIYRSWAYLPIESLAEAFSIGFLGWGTDKSMDYGHTLDPAKARAFFDGEAGITAMPPPVSVDYPVDWLGPVPSPNFTVGRQGNPVSLIVDHWMAGTFDAALARFMNPTAIVSAHYLIGTTGHIAQVVRDEDTAYHSGDWDINTMSIGIEHEASPTVLPSDALYAASAWLHAQLAERHGITLEVGVTVIPHRQVVATQCPGTLDLDRIVSEAEDDMFSQADREMLTRVKDILEAREGLVWAARVQRGNLDVESGKLYNPLLPPTDPRIDQRNKP